MSNNGLKSGSNLEKVLKAGHFAFTGECGPPKGANVEHLKEKYEHLRGIVDAVNVTDNQTAVVRMSSCAASALMAADGIEPNFQMVCRDRNRLAMMADVLGVYSLGIKNMLCLSGDHQQFGNHPESKNVYDIDSVQLISLVKKMRAEVTLLGYIFLLIPVNNPVGAGRYDFLLSRGLIRIYHHNSICFIYIGIDLPFYIFQFVQFFHRPPFTTYLYLAGYCVCLRVHKTDN